jgi:1-acyl-sn-glycerol-3-phosphate acyltransferase
MGKITHGYILQALTIYVTQEWAEYQCAGDPSQSPGQLWYEAFMSDLTAPLTRFERAALAMARFANERPLPKRLQRRFLQSVTRTWVRPAISRRVYVENMDWLHDLSPDRGVVFVANHRSFFDMYIVMLGLFEPMAPWIERIFFPVRANFFYEQPLGVAVNFLIGGGCMYPPIFRDVAKSALNKDAVERVVRLLEQPGVVVGLHPEGTRGKGPDPYELLPAQPGVGQIVLQARPIVVPVFVNGLPNDVRRGIGDTFREDARREHPIIVVAGDELDYSEFTAHRPRAALYKRCADRMNDAIRELGERERQIRAACARGEVADSDGGWQTNRMLRG